MKTAAELRITESERRALEMTAELFESGMVKHLPLEETGKATGNWFNMSVWNSETGFDLTRKQHECGSVRCIGGWAEHLNNVSFDKYVCETEYHDLELLFYPEYKNRIIPIEFKNVTTAQAAAAIRNYLRDGKPNWDEVLKGTDE